MSSPRPRPWWLRPPALLTVLFLLVVAGVFVLQGRPPSGPTAPPAPPFAAQPDPDPQRHPCAPGTQKTDIWMAASTEKWHLLAELAAGTDPAVRQSPDNPLAKAARYNDLPDGCAIVHVENVQSGQAADALHDDGFLDLPSHHRADVWSPASSAWIGVANAPCTAQKPCPRRPATPTAVVPGFGYALARTPLVFAMSRTTADRFGGPGAPWEWTDQRVPTLGKLNPLVSTPGLLALLHTWQAAPPGTTGADFAQNIENRVAHYGTSELDFLGDLAAKHGDDPSTVGTVPVEEKAVWDYNHSNSPADPQLQAPTPLPASQQLAALTPAGRTYYSDSPFLVLDEQKRAAADDFRKWLRSDDQQKLFQQFGFRDALGRGGPDLGPVNGLAATPPPPLELPDAGTINDVRNQWPGWRKPANVLLVMDSSGSMKDPIPEERPGPARLLAVRTAAENALNSAQGLGPRDKLAMWTFSSAPGPGRLPYQQAVPLPPNPPPPPSAQGAPTASAVPAAKDVLDHLQPGGNTALYQSLRDAVGAMREAYSPDRVNAVIVFTDGGETEEVNDQSALARTKQTVAPTPGQNLPVYVIAYGPKADSSREDLIAIARATGGHFYDLVDQPDRIDEVFSELVSNF